MQSPWITFAMFCITSGLAAWMTLGPARERKATQDMLEKIMNRMLDVMEGRDKK